MALLIWCKTESKVKRLGRQEENGYDNQSNFKECPAWFIYLRHRFHRAFNIEERVTRAFICVSRRLSVHGTLQFELELAHRLPERGEDSSIISSPVLHSSSPLSIFVLGNDRCRLYRSLLIPSVCVTFTAYTRNRSCSAVVSR
ncbi:hypothetical protein AVEN_182348-1 [Araneus ventricosus]|uniref:Uncharacterized protein n=1 Tax=Araneus ventricosus TaxID=182803 RepID=A0A4Y2TRG4_ARAVE|nr:hypothetical protein AVEN_182348-1 [Araneus ventricosus]